VTTPSALDAYQDSAARTINRSLTDEQRLLDAAAGLAEEAGEVLAHVRKHVMQGRPLDRDAVTKELGDALWCIAIVARSLEVPMSEVAARNLEKLAARYPDGFPASGIRE
jgi:NTP pyrophosphatase (non-canonical NTP hydrolase)